MKKNVLWFVVLAIIFSIGVGCNDQTDRRQMNETERMVAEAHAQVGMPNIVNFQEKRLMRQIMELRDQENLNTYTYLVSWDAQLVFLGNSIGFGLPASVQYTNPKRPIYRSSGSVAVPQAEANGLFMSDNLDATWIMLVSPNGEARPVYVENPIVVSPFKLH